MGDELFDAFAIIPFVFVVIFGLMFICVFIFGMVIAVKSVKNSRFFKKNKLEDTPKTTIVVNKPEDDYIECKYCGMKNKKGSTKCSACNAKL